MSFKLPKLKKSKRAPSDPNVAVVNDIPTFNTSDVSNKLEIGRGSFSTVYCGQYRNEDVVVKVLHQIEEQDGSKAIFLKEARLLSSLQHKNIVKFYAASVTTPHALLLEYLYFDFEPFDRDIRVSSVKKFLNEISDDDFENFGVVVPKIASDITEGVVYLHEHGVAHRDLKTGNILVSNNHYCHIKDENFVEEIWLKEPIKCKLTDFGESRSELIKTKSATMTTNNANRGTPAYMAPEIMLPEMQSSKLALGFLKSVDIWALGLTFYNLVNPSLSAPYIYDLRNANIVPSNYCNHIKYMHKMKKLPSPLPEFDELQRTTWKDVQRAYELCAVFEANERPTAGEVLECLHNSEKQRAAFVNKQDNGQVGRDQRGKEDNSSEPIIKVVQIDDDSIEENPSKRKVQRDDDDSKGENPSKRKVQRDDDDSTAENPSKRKAQRDDDDSTGENPSKRKAQRDDDDSTGENPSKRKVQRDDDDSKGENPSKRKVQRDDDDSTGENPSKRKAQRDDDDSTGENPSKRKLQRDDDDSTGENPSKRKVQRDDDDNTDEDLMHSVLAQPYKGNSNLPVYQWGLRKGIKTEKIADLIVFAERVPSCHIASCVPTAIEHNTVFLVDGKKLCNTKDIKSDDLGQWKISKSQKKHFFTPNGEGGLVEISEHEVEDYERVFVIYRSYYVNISLGTLKKSIATGKNLRTGEILDLKFVQDVFHDKEQKVPVKPHGNRRRSSRPYKRTMESTKELIKGNLKQNSPRKAFHRVVQERGGLDNIQSAGEFPRDRTQIYNIKRNLLCPKESKSSNGNLSNDPLLQVLIKAKEAQCNQNQPVFIRDIPMFPEPVVFLANDQQLLDIERFCTNPESFCVMGVDATFQIADFYYTFATYRNLLLETDKGVNPVCIGPGILHKRKLHSSYKNLPLLMTKYQPGTSGVLVYGTDGEPNISNALAEVHTVGYHLECDIHLKDNTQTKMRKLGMSKHVQSEIQADIFGQNIGDKREGGLIDCVSEEEFDKACDNVTKKWAKEHEMGQEFATYFLKEKAGVLRQCCRADIRSMCGLGFPPKVYTQNANECMNRLIKEKNIAKYGSTSLDLISYVNNIEKEVKRQQEEQFLAVIGRGEYCLSSDFQFLKVEETDFYRMSNAQKAELRKRFFTITMSEGLRSSKGVQMQSNTDFQLSVTAAESLIIEVPFPVLEGMFEKASATVRERGKIWKVPTDDNKQTVYMVASQTKPSCPHKVIVKGGGKVSCDHACPQFGTYHICSHSISAAEMSDCLKGFLTSYKKSKTKINVTKLATINMPAGAGNKQSTKNRKGSANKPVKTLTPSHSRVLHQSMTFHQTPSRQQAFQSRSIPGGAESGILLSSPWPYDCYPSANLSSQTSPALVPGIPAPTFSVPSLPGPELYGIPISTPALPKPALGMYVTSLLSYCDSRVSVCYGCRQTLKPSGAIPSPPHDMVIVSTQFRTYRKDGKDQTSPRPSLVYYHASLPCVPVLMQNVHLCQTMLSVPHDIIPHLNDLHKRRLRDMFLVAV